MKHNRPHSSADLNDFWRKHIDFPDSVRVERVGDEIDQISELFLATVSATIEADAFVVQAVKNDAD